MRPASARQLSLLRHGYGSLATQRPAAVKARDSRGPLLSASCASTSCRFSSFAGPTASQPRLQTATAAAASLLHQSRRASSFTCASSSETPRQHQAASGSDGKPDWDIKMLYDGDCPLCMREVNMLKRRDAGKDRIAFVDIAAPDYSPQANAGISFEEAMGEIHAILPDQGQGEKVVKNIEVFSRLYAAVGLGWVYGFTKYEPLRKAADAVYAVWARFRLPVTGREDLATILAKREEKTCRRG